MADQVQAAGGGDADKGLSASHAAGIYPHELHYGRTRFKRS